MRTIPAGRHRAPKTFTPWRALFLLVIFPIAFLATGALIRTTNPELMNATVEHAGQPPVVTIDLVPGVTIR